MRALKAACERLVQVQGRAPSPAELAASLGTSVEQTVEGFKVAQAYAPVPLSAGLEDEEDAALQAEAFAVDDEQLELIEDREAVAPLLAALLRLKGQGSGYGGSAA
jgi:RNA polymerase sigma-B factor